MEETQKETQKQKIIDYLKTHKDITSMEAYDKLKITQFATRVKELEKRGWIFNKEWDYAINKKGEKKRFKRYSIDRVDNLNKMISENMEHIPTLD